MVTLMKPDNQIVDTIIQGDCLEMLRTLDTCSVDAIVTDPPAGINFMMKEFDSDRGGRKQWVAWLTEIMIEALRCLRPGGHALVWALPRTSHWTALALEDAGFEIREKLYHIHGQGFPKSKNLGNGMGSALKPAVEEWILCRKPLSESSIAANVLKWGTSGLNIDACRVGTQAYTQEQWTQKGLSRVTGNSYGVHKASDTPVPQGRFPSNLLLSHSLFCVPLGTRKVKGNGPPNTTGSASTNNDYGIYQQRSMVTHRDSEGMETIQAWECAEDCPIRLLDEQSGIRKSGGMAGKRYEWKQDHGASAPFAREGDLSGRCFADQGGASRYFTQFCYTAKASRAERNRGCEGLPEKIHGDYNNGKGFPGRTQVDGEWQNTGNPRLLQVNNHHPTVKPLQLMSWLCRLITPPGGTVLDCFAGSGSTCVAAIHERLHFIAIEQDASYCEIARARVAHAFGEVTP